jgi:hypothetical protein
LAHFAKLDENNLVTQIVVTDNEMPNEGYDWLQKNLPGVWIQTSYNTLAGKHSQGKTPLRKNFAGIGFTYDKKLDAFIPPKPYNSWILDKETCQWQAPIPMPIDENNYIWDEELATWITE